MAIQARFQNSAPDEMAFLSHLTIAHNIHSPALRLRQPAKGLSIQEPHEDEVMLCISRPRTGRLDAGSVSSYEVYTPDMAVNIRCGKEKAPIYRLANLCHTTERPQKLLIEIYLERT